MTVVKDTLAPTIKSVVGGFWHRTSRSSSRRRCLRRRPDAGANYSLSGGLVISGATVLARASVRLATTTQTPGTKYTLTVNGIRDLASGSRNLITANSKLDFTSFSQTKEQVVVVGDPGNPKDTQWNTARGRVGLCLISKSRVRNSEYAAYLECQSQVRPAQPHRFRQRGDDSRRRRRQLSLHRAGRAWNRPVLFVAVDAMWMANWLSNEETGERDKGNQRLYTVPSGYDVVSTRNPNADYVRTTTNGIKPLTIIPPKNGTGGYWQYPPKTDDPADLLAEAPRRPGLGQLRQRERGRWQRDDRCGRLYGGIESLRDIRPGGLHVGMERTGRSDHQGNEPPGRFPGNAVARLAAGAIASNGIDKGGATVNQGFHSSQQVFQGCRIADGCRGKSG